MISRFITSVRAAQPAIFMATGLGCAGLDRHWLATAILFFILQLGTLVGAVLTARFHVRHAVNVRFVARAVGAPLATASAQPRLAARRPHLRLVS
jgi:hypothetical protein